MNQIRKLQEINQRELEAGIPPSASWHRDFADTAFIYIGGLPYELSEGDIVTIFSQYGEPVYINLARDKETGKSKGFAFLKYEDQRSTDLAVDNMSGANVLGRTIRVDHSRYKARDDERIYDNTNGADGEVDTQETDDEHSRHRSRHRRRREIDEGSDQEEKRPMLTEEKELAKLLREHDDDDPMKEYLVQQKQEEVDLALHKQNSERKSRNKEDQRHRKHRHRHRSDRENDRERSKEDRRVREDDEQRQEHRSRRERRSRSHS